MSVYCRPLKAPAVEGEKNAPIMFVKVRTSTKSRDCETCNDSDPIMSSLIPSLLCEPGNETTKQGHGDIVEYPCVCVRVGG